VGKHNLSWDYLVKGQSTGAGFKPALIQETKVPAGSRQWCYGITAIAVGAHRDAPILRVGLKPAPTKEMRRALFIIGWIFFIHIPTRRIIDNVPAYPQEVGVIPYDMFVIIALP
jgi:hypothetical protein